ncbi:MAG: tyrosine--tRNA ligase, partial [Planctomycetes bacterium]|nr:tyrosine--tRNA ligase [Planctomycetota bacterium]
MANFFDVMKERGFVSQATHEDLAARFDRGPVTGYVGFDPTSASLHAGSLIQILMLMHLQRCGHRPIAIVGGATGLIGDPSGKTEMRTMLTEDDLARNLAGIRAQLSRFIRFGDGPTDALILDNAEWLRDRKYIEFLREIGPHFSVNRMLTLESVKLRLEKGLSFLEFNYQVLQAYDFMVLNRRYGCTLQMGGDDQWGNIVMGMELTRRMNGAEVFGITSPLITTADGRKMGKTEGGAVWLDAERTSPYAFYQYW